MACWQQLLLVLFIALVVAQDATPTKKDDQPLATEHDSPATELVEAAPVAAALHRTKRHEIEIHRVIKRRPKLPPPPPRGRKPRPPRRPGSKPRVKYGPPNVQSYKPLAHYVPQSIDDAYSSGFESSFADHHGSFGEPPAGYGPPIHPSPTYGSPPFAYGQTITTSYEGSSFGKPSPGYDAAPSFVKHGGYPGSSSSSASVSPSSSFPKHSYENAGFDGGFPKATFGNGPSIFESKVPSFGDTSSSSFGGFPGGKHSPSLGGYSHSFSHSAAGNNNNNRQPTYADSSPINSYTTSSGKGGSSYYGDLSASFGADFGSGKHQLLPLETHKKDPYKAPVTSYEVPSNPKSHLFEPSGDFDTGSSYKRAPHNGGSTHSTSHSTVGSSEEEPYIPALPTRYDQEQFHTPTKTNPNKPSISTLQTIGGDNDHFTSFTSYYDGGSESQKVPVKSGQPPTFAPDENDYQQQQQQQSGGKNRLKTRRKKKPKFPAHNLDTDDLRDAFGSSSDFHQVAIDADEFLEFEPKKQIKHSKPAGVTAARPEEPSGPSNFVLLSSQNKGAGKVGSRDGQSKPRSSAATPTQQQASPGGSSSSSSSSKSIEYDSHSFDLGNYFQGGATGNHRARPGASAQDDLNILSIQKSNSKSYYAGSSQPGGNFQPTRRRDMTRYRSAPASLDYTMLDEDDDESYDEISDIGTRIRGNRKKKDLSEESARRTADERAAV